MPRPCRTPEGGRILDGQELAQTQKEDEDLEPAVRGRLGLAVVVRVEVVRALEAVPLVVRAVVAECLIPRQSLPQWTKMVTGSSQRMKATLEVSLTNETPTATARFLWTNSRKPSVEANCR